MATKIDFSERSYGGKKFRPAPIVHREASNNLLVCLTTWGRDDIAKTVLETITSHIALADEDTDRTVVFAQKDELHQMGNNLRSAVIAASEKVAKQQNKDEYQTGFEIFAAIQDGPQWIYVSCGQPCLVLHRAELGSLPLVQNVDLNVLSPRSSLVDPLPHHLLGLGQHPPIQYGNLRLKAGDRLALVSRTFLPNQFFQLTMDNFTIDEISQVLANDNKDIPFWLGFIQAN